MNARLRLVAVGVAHRWRKLQGSRYFAPVVIAVLILAANSPSIIGPYQHNPIFTNSGQLVSSQKTTLPGLNTIDPTDGTSSQSLGRAAIKQLVHGRLPWWNHNEQIGAPLAGDMQSAALFPLVALYALPHGFLMVHVLLECIAALFTFLLLRRLKVSRFAATLAGIMFGLSGVFAWFGAANVNPVPFLPMLLYGVEVIYLAAKRPQPSKLGWSCIPLGIALSVYAGFPEVAYVDGLLALAWSMVRLCMLASDRRRVFFGRALLGAVVGILLALPIILAFVDYLPYADVGLHNAANKDVLPFFGLSALFMPYIYGPIFGFTGVYKPLIGWWGSVGGFVSGLTILLAGAGLWNKGLPRPIKWTVSAISVVAILRIFGFPGTVAVLNLLPGMSQTAADRYLWPVLCMTAVILAAFGIDLLIAKRRQLKMTPKTGLSMAALLAAVAVALIPALTIQSHIHKATDYYVWFGVSVGWLLISLGAVLLVQYGRSLILKRVIIAAIVLVDSLGMFIIPQLSAVRKPNMDLAPLSFLHANLGDYRFFSLGPIAANYSSYYGLASINTNNIPIVKSWGDYIHHKLNPVVKPISFNGNIEVPGKPTEKQEFLAHLRNFEAVNVKYLVANRDVVSPQEARQYALTNVYEDASVDIYQLPNVAPYFSVTGNTCTLAPTDRDTLTADCAKDTELKRVEAYLPGWQATVNGDSQAVRQTSNHFQAITLRKGPNTVRYSYTPPHMRFAYAGLAIGLLGLLYGCFGRAIGSFWRRDIPKKR